MANIYGTSHYSWSANRWIANDDLLFGTSAADYIDSGGGRDTIFTGLGNDTVFAGSGDDWIGAGANGSSGVGAWGNDIVWAGDGADTIDYSNTLSSVTLYGEAGRDTISGGHAGDSLYGGADGDFIYGNGGDDYIDGGTGGDFLKGMADRDTIRGGSGVDTIDGGSGNDWIVGGADGDWLYGGSGQDIFTYETAFESGLTWATADTIMDYDPTFDYLNFPVAGTQFNYVETDVRAQTFEIARDWAAGQIAHGARYAFASAADYGIGANGYLFADVDGNGTIDTGIELRGIGLSQLNYTDII